MNTEGFKMKIGYLIALFTLILSISLFGVAQIQSKADKVEVCKVEERSERRDNQIQEELRESIKVLSCKQDEMYKLLWEMSKLNKREK